MSYTTKPARPLAAERAQPARTPAPITVSARFCGPPGSGNGGYVCGRIAAYVDGPVTVTLRRPAPLATVMAVELDGQGCVRIHDGPPPLAEAHAAPGGARYYTDPLFPGCFVCGMDRRPGDGLRIFPGPVAGRPLWAAPWTPDPSVTDADGRLRPEMAWAALDCPSGIAAAEAADLARDTAILLGQMTARLAALPVAGDECQVIAWPDGRDGAELR